MSKNNQNSFRNKKGNGKNSRSNSGDRRTRGKNDKYSEAEAKHEAEAAKGKTRARNSLDWYGTSSVLMKDAANIPFSQYAGQTIDLSGEEGNRVTTNATTSFNVPGIMTLKFIPTPGTAVDWSSPVNVAIRDMYSYIRHANSGHSNYDAANLGMYLMAYDSCACYYAWMVRLYGTLRTVLTRNRFTPEKLVRAMHADYASLVANAAQFRSYINTFAARLFVMKVPSKFHVIERHMWMTTHVFLDAPTDKAQFYIFNPALFWKYQLGETPEETGMFPYLTDKLRSRTEVLTYEEIVSFGEELLNSILNDEDFNIMSGDILKAYGDNVFHLNMISDEYSVMPTYEPEALLQIHNASILDDTGDKFIDDWSITEDMSETAEVGALHNNFKFSGGVNTLYLLMGKLCDLPFMEVAVPHVAVATRLMACGEVRKNVDKYELHVTACGSEILVGLEIVTIESDGTAKVAVWNDSSARQFDLDVFDMHPALIKCMSASFHDVDNGNPYCVCQLTDVCTQLTNWTVIKNSTLANIHRAALMGMYGITG